MKILFLTRKFWPSIGGVEKHCLEVGKNLVEKGNKVTVVTEEEVGVGDMREMGEVGKIKILRIPITAGERLKKFQIWWWLIKHRDLITKSNIVHCHDVFFWFLPFRLLYPFKKVFTTFHGWEGVYPPTFKAKIIRKISEKLSFGNVCVGDYVQKWYGTKPDFVTYGGVELTQDVTLRQDKTQNEDSESRKILFIGRLDQDTGLPIYLESLKILKDKGIQTEVVFLGDGKLRNETKNYGTAAGFVNNVRKYVLEATYIFTSGYLSILEAMINKRLVFAVYGNSLKKDYLLMSPFAHLLALSGNAEDLAKEVWYYLNHSEEEKQIVTDASKWAKEQTWEKLTDQYLHLWKK